MYAFIYGVSSFFFMLGVLVIIGSILPPANKDEGKVGVAMALISLLVIVATTIGRFAS